MHIYFLQTTLDPESLAAWQWLEAAFPAARKITVEQIPVSGKNKILWWHGSERQFVESRGDWHFPLSRFLRTGGRVFFSLAAVLAVTSLGLEKEPPNLREDGAYDDKTGEFEIRGLMGFLRHLIYAKIGNPDGSTSGVYLWKPRTGAPHWRFGFGPEQWPVGKVWGVHRFHIGFDSRFKFAWEYDAPRVLCVGAYMHFGDAENLYAQHLRRFAAACLAYLAEPLPRQRFHWQKSVASVTRMTRRTIPDPTFSGQRVNYVEMPPKLQAPAGSDNFFALAGERILLMGSERGRIKEIWGHPVRLCKNLSVKIRAAKAEQLWDDAANAEVTLRPHDITRDDGRITEHIWVSADQPLACFDWQFGDCGEVEVEICFEVDFRLMWPYAEGCLSGIQYACSKNDGTIVFTDAQGLFVAQFSLSSSGEAPRVEDVSTPNSSCAKVTFYRRIKTPRNTSRHTTLQFVIVGGSVEDGQVRQLRRDFPEHLRRLYVAQVRLQNRLLENHAEIDTPEPAFNAAARWAKLKTAAFVCTVPSLGKSLLAGFAPTGEGWLSGRPGYAWFFGRDACWTAFAMLHYGDFENVRSVLEFLARHHEFTGKILHELSTSGAVHYDAADSTPLYVILMARYVDHSGDVDFLRAQWQHVQKAIEFMLSTDRDGDGLIENTAVGHGWIEGGKLYGVHVEHYLAGCWAEALRSAAHCAALIGEKTAAEKWEGVYARVRSTLDDDFWNARQGYFYHGKKQNGTLDENITLLAAVPMLFGYGKDEHVLRSLEILAGKRFNTDWGVRIVGDDHPFYGPQGYHYGSVWPLFTGWAALAAFKRGRALSAMSQLKNSMRNFQHGAMGCMEEVLHGEKYQPAGVCPHQAWSESMILQPIFEGLLGFLPHATRHEVELTPRVPCSWPFFSAGPLRIGAHMLYFSVERDGADLSLLFSQKGSKLRLFCTPHFPAAAQIDAFELNGQHQSLTIFEKYDERAMPFEATLGDTPLRAVFRIPQCWSAIAPVADVTPGQGSAGYMIIREFKTPAGVAVEIEGDAGSRHQLHFVMWGYEITHVRGGNLVSLEGEKGVIDFTFGDGENRYTRQVIDITLK